MDVCVCVKSGNFSNKTRKFNLKNKYLLVRFYIGCEDWKIGFFYCTYLYVCVCVGSVTNERKTKTQKKFFANLFIELENGLNFMNIRERKMKIKKT